MISMPGKITIMGTVFTRPLLKRVCFDGNCDTLYEKISNFKPWYQKGV